MTTLGPIRAPLALLVVAALLLAACQGGGPTTTNPIGQIGSDQPDPNGELITNLGSEPDTIDPHKASFVGEIAVVMSVFEGLMTLDPKTLRPVPAAAAKDPDVTPDGKQWKFTVRDGLKFSDGSPLTAKDFERGFLRTCDPRTAGDYAFVLYVVAGCEKWNTMDVRKASAAELDAAKRAVGIKAVDEKTLQLDLIEPAAYFGSIAYMWVGMPVKQESLDKGGERWTEPATYIGNGPFKLTSWKHNESMVFERNEHYWRGPAKLKKWTRVMLNEGAVAFAAYRNNEIDTLGVSAEDLRTIESDNELRSQMRDVAGSCTYYIGFNSSRPPMDDPNVRIAFARSFDRDGYIRDIQKIGAAANGGFIPPGIPGYDKDDTAQRFDPAAAKAALAKSKYSGQAELRSVKFTYASSSRTKTRVEWLQQQWKNNLGVEAIPDPVDSTAYTQLVKKLETTPLMFILGWCADFPDQQNWLTTVFHSTSTVAKTGWKNAKYDELVRQADRESDKAKRDQMYLDASRMLSAEAPAAWLYYVTGKIMIKPWVKGVTTTALDSVLGQFRMWEVYVTKKG
ncbi:MAG: peptide ABC transporter substrate-binding protein [Chloroflexi bacterium]|nr:peptide ABC transporter substrate-binding protein [Chloroflexota bacterium]